MCAWLDERKDGSMDDWIEKEKEGKTGRKREKISRRGA